MSSAPRKPVSRTARRLTSGSFAMDGMRDLVIRGLQHPTVAKMTFSSFEAEGRSALKAAVLDERERLRPRLEDAIVCTPCDCRCYCLLPSIRIAVEVEESEDDVKVRHRCVRGAGFEPKVARYSAERAVAAADQSRA